mgnify:FL=1
MLALVLVALGIATYLPLPSPVLAVRPPWAPYIMSVTLTPARQVGLVATLLACAAVDSLVRTDRRLARSGLAQTVPFWIVPGLLILGAFRTIEDLSGLTWQALAAGGTVLLLGLVAAGQLHTLDSADRWFAPARLGLNAASYALALGAYLLTELLRSRALVAPPLIALVSGALALPLLYSVRTTARHLWGTAALVGLLMGQVAWALSPGVVAPPVASFLLLLVFYGVTGVLQQELWGRLERRVTIEFLVVALVALGLVLRLRA